MVALNKKKQRRLVVLNQVEGDKTIGYVKAGMLAAVHNLFEDF